MTTQTRLALDLAGSAKAGQRLLVYQLGRRSVPIVALVAAILFGLLSSVRLTGQGLYYDELHQATASFAYLGRDGEMFSALSVEGIPVLNMSYSGAIKTAIYGLYLRAFNTRFEVISWRLLGVMLAAGGIVAMFLLAGKSLTAGWTIAFLGFLLTDATVILAVRHDWGPVALSLLLRLIFIAIWLKSTVGDVCKPSSTFLLALTAAFALFEKLSNFVLVLPLMIAFVFDVRRRTPRHYLALILGGSVGIAPLALVNLYTLAVNGWPVSLTPTGSAPDLHLSETLKFAGDYLALGQGALLRAFILGMPLSNPWPEAFLAVALLALVVWIIVRHRRQSAYLRFATMALLSYVAIGVTLRFMPQPNSTHHWILGTPFQYAAIASALTGMWEVYRPGRDRWVRMGFMALLIMWIAYRLIWLAQLEVGLTQGRASYRWDPSLTEVGKFAAANSDTAVFVAADWGVAAQIVALSNGEPEIVHEVFWTYESRDDIEQIADGSGKSVLYVVAKEPRSGVAIEKTEQIWRDIGNMRRWREVPVEAETTNWKAVAIRKFIRVQP